MALPSFSKTGVTTFTFSRPELFPYSYDPAPRQLIKKTATGKIYTYTMGPEEIIISAPMVLQGADFTGYLTFFRNVLVNWAENSVTWTDCLGVATVVRNLSPRLGMPEQIAGTYPFTLTLRVEV